MSLKVANNNSLSAITALPSGVSGGAMNLLETQTASSSSTLSFTSNIDSTYDEYVFKFYDIHPATDDTDLQFQVDTGTNTNYNQTMTTTCFDAYHINDGSNTFLGYVTNRDQAQGTSFQSISQDVGNGNDESLVGYLKISAPSNTTFVKHFIARTNSHYSGNGPLDFYTAGYINTTTALTRVQFKMESGNMDSGTIKLYGIS
jgi:hypothetical protein